MLVGEAALSIKSDGLVEVDQHVTVRYLILTKIFLVRMLRTLSANTELGLMSGDLVILVAKVSLLLKWYTCLILAHVLILSLEIALALADETGLFLFGPRVHLLCIVEASIVLTWAPALIMVVMSLVVVVVALVMGVLSCEVVQFGHVAQLIDWFPLNFRF